MRLKGHKKWTRWYGQDDSCEIAPKTSTKVFHKISSVFTISPIVFVVVLRYTYAM